MCELGVRHWEGMPVAGVGELSSFCAIPPAKCLINPNTLFIRA
jgi:hypothetical protein